MRRIVNSNVCVIGGAGFLGSHLVNHLIDDRGCSVLVLDNLISGLRKHVHRAAKFEWFDIRDSAEQLYKKLVIHKIQFVFNYAAEPYIPECFDNPLHFFNINAVSVLRVLDACKSAEIEAILQVGSAEIYGDMTGKIKETDQIAPHSTYGVSKLAADSLIKVRWKEAKVPTICLRQFNCVGERETHDYVVPEIISQVNDFVPENFCSTSDDTVYVPRVKLGNNSTRDFLYAGDAVRMAVELLENGNFGEVYNLGSQECIEIYDLAVLIGKIMGCDVIIEPDTSRVRPWEIWHLQSDNTKIHMVISARLEVSLEEALRRTVVYFKQNNCKWDW